MDAEAQRTSDAGPLMADAAGLTMWEQAMLTRAPRKAGGAGYPTREQAEFQKVRDRISDENSWMAVPALAPVGIVAPGVVRAVDFIRFGDEIQIGDDWRLAPFGNRRGNRLGNLPHYHRRGPRGPDGSPPRGQGVKRHRPWETKDGDTSFWDRF
jgi:hypothetical protein